MAIDTEEVNVKFGATTDEFVSHVAQIREILQGLTNPLRGLRTNLGEIAEAFAAAFAVEKIADFVEKISEMGAEVEHATHELGMSAEEVSSLNVAFGLMGVSAEAGTMSLMRLERSMATAQHTSGAAAQAFTALGIPIDQLKNMKPEDVLKRMADKFSTTADGANKTEVAWALMGRAAGRMIPVLDEGREGLARLGLVADDTGAKITGPMAEGMEKTAQAVKTLKFAFTGIAITLFEAFKPAIDVVLEGLIAMAEAFNDNMKQGGIFNTTLAAIVIAVDLVIAAFVVMIALIKDLYIFFNGLFLEILAGWNLVAQVMNDVIHLKFDEMKTHWSEGMSQMAAIFAINAGRIETTGEEMGKRIRKLFDNIHMNAGELPTVDTSGGKEKPKPDLPQMPGMTPIKEENMSDLEAELHREEQGWQIHWDQLKEFEAAFWEGILKRTDVNAKDYNAIVNKAFSSQEALAHERVAKEGALEKEVTANKKAALEDQQQQEKAADDFSVQHGLMKVSAQIAAERKLTEDTFNQIRDRLEYEKNTVGQMPEFYRKVDEEILQLERKHKGDLAALNRDSVADFIKPWEDATAAINSSMDTMLNGILMGTQSFSDAMKNLWNNLVLTLIEYELKLLIVKVSNTAKEAVLNNGMIMSWFGMETAKSTISQGAAAQRAAVDTTAQTGFFGHIGGWLGQWFGFEEAKTTTTEAAAAQRATVTSAATIAGNVALVAAAFGQIQVDAAMAAAATFASISAIPIIGPELAPEAAAEAYITTMGFASGLGGGLAFEQGGLIPHGVNPIAQLHQNEMILPAKLSQGMQGLIASGGVGAGGGDTTINVHVAGSNASPDSIARAVSQAMRDFHPAFRRR